MNIVYGVISSMIFRILQTLVTSKLLKVGILNGAWCTCWKTGDSDNYETGTVDINHIGRKLRGNFYHQDKKWPFTGKYNRKENKAQFEFYHKNQEKGIVKIKHDKTPSKWHGTWSGLVTTSSKDQKKLDSLPLKLAKDNCVHDCHIRCISNMQDTCCWK